ncbi:MAG: metal-sensing transcriptional repressor [Ectothiorhodospiraceae bacterium]|nr:metal-sensing transcriptional repressor [Ectothiorhodospiraceae bacterium]
MATASEANPVLELDPRRRALVARLARVEGQLRAIRRMVEAQRPCEDVAQQLSASRKALDKAFYEMLACAMERDLPGGELPEPARDRLEQLTRLLTKYG